MNLDVYCDRCDSDNVTIKCIDEIKLPERISMSELPHLPKNPVVHAVRVISNYRATCQDCGHYVEWSE